jgi:hypothetical protein
MNWLQQNRTDIFLRKSVGLLLEHDSIGTSEIDAKASSQCRNQVHIHRFRRKNSLNRFDFFEQIVVDAEFVANVSLNKFLH